MPRGTYIRTEQIREKMRQTHKRLGIKPPSQKGKIILKARTGEYKLCPICGKSFYVQLNVIKAGLGKYCSVNCTDKSKKKERIKRICVICGKEFSVREKYLSRGKNYGTYCSNDCANKNKERHFSHQGLMNLRRQHIGRKNHQWKGGLTPLIKRIRDLSEYKEWRHKVFVRGEFTCVECHKVGGKLNAHHTKAFIKIIRQNNIQGILEAQTCKELWHINNGVTLCKPCHDLTKGHR